MKCEDAEMLMMKYMDGEINEIEAESLNGHLLVCPKCRQACEVYDSMLSGMSEMETAEAPEGFENAVMMKIRAIEKPEPVYSSRDKFKIRFGGSFAAVLFIGLMLMAYRDDIIGVLSLNQYTAGRVEGLKAFSEMIAMQAETFMMFFNNVIESVNAVLASGSLFIAGGIVALCAVQAFLARKKNR